MGLFKFLIGSFLLSAPLVAENEAADGWFPVEQKEETPFDATEIDPSIWVVFAKSLGDEKIFLRFPEDPSYHRPAPGVLEILASKEGEQFRLRVIERTGDGDPIVQRGAEIQALPEAEFLSDQEGEFLYRLEGKWVREHIIHTPGHIFLFQTVSAGSDGENHRIFIDSFQVEGNF